jgi:hypothetical protein
VWDEYQERLIEKRKNRLGLSDADIRERREMVEEFFKEKQATEVNSKKVSASHDWRGSS